MSQDENILSFKKWKQEYFEEYSVNSPLSFYSAQSVSEEKTPQNNANKAILKGNRAKSFTPCNKKEKKQKCVHFSDQKEIYLILSEKKKADQIANEHLERPVEPVKFQKQQREICDNICKIF